MKLMKSPWMFLPLTLLLLLFTPVSQSMMVLPVNLDDLSKQADIAFRGVCIEKTKSAFTHPDTKEAIPIWTYTFRVEEVVKGSVDQSFYLKQWAPLSAEEPLKGNYGPFLATTTFDVGKEYLLFLSAPSPFGFRTVLGYDQGKFSVTKNAQGKSVVVNPYNNRGLMQGIPAKGLSKSQKELLKAPSGPIPYDEFVPLVKKAVE
ncbi:MAG: hypothetical protein HY877_07145 [Deltaproteobacteria bacterium]|nr:hypothetical protein [Deltaproteobacteria bacterium]